MKWALLLILRDGSELRTFAMRWWQLCHWAPIWRPPVNSSPASLVQAVLARHVDQPGALLPILHEVQDGLGHVPREVVPQIAEALNLSRAEVHGVVTYYHHFRSAAPGRHVIQVCRAEACQAMGGEALLAHAERTLGCATHGGHGATSSDGRYTLNPVYCLGLCASSPAVTIDDRLHARMTPAKFDELVRTCGEAA
jgi:formate dehydrogenase subunit gamma